MLTTTTALIARLRAGGVRLIRETMTPRKPPSRWATPRRRERYWLIDAARPATWDAYTLIRVSATAAVRLYGVEVPKFDDGWRISNSPPHTKLLHLRSLDDRERALCGRWIAPQEIERPWLTKRCQACLALAKADGAR